MHLQRHKAWGYEFVWTWVVRVLMRKCIVALTTVALLVV